MKKLETIKVLEINIATCFNLQSSYICESIEKWGKDHGHTPLRIQGAYVYGAGPPPCSLSSHSQ